MRALWIDTGPLLDLTVHELADRSMAAYRRLEGTLDLLHNKTQPARFQDQAGEFGAARFSIGSVVELHQQARKHLCVRDAGTGLMVVFWEAFRAVLRRQQASPAAMDFDRLDRDSLARFGPVDAHLLDEVSRDVEAWLTTGDRALRGVVSDRSRGRVLDLS